MRTFYKSIALLGLFSTFMGVVGVWKGAPQVETIILNNLIEANASKGFVLPMFELMAGWYWGLISIVMGFFLAFGFFWDLEWWPEKAVMIPAVGFITLNFGFSIYMMYGIFTTIKSPQDLVPFMRAGTGAMYGIMILTMVVGIVAHYYYEGDMKW